LPAPGNFPVHLLLSNNGSKEKKRKWERLENIRKGKISFPIFQIVGSIFDVQGKTYSVRPEFFIS
jgi:hypothetical protein